MSIDFSAAIAAATETVKDLGAGRLSGMADLACPDNVTPGELSPGADMLDTLRLSFLEAIDYRADDIAADELEDADKLRNLLDEAEHEAADGAIPIYTWTKWQAFTDLTAWTVDISGLGEVTDMESGANWSLYEANRILWGALVEHFAEALAEELEALRDAEGDDEE